MHSPHNPARMTGMRRSRASRALRGLIGASIATFVALLSHVAAGGAMPGWVGIALPWLLSVMVCTLLAGRALSLIRLSLAVAASQALFHCLFVFGFITGAGPAAAALGAHAHHLLPGQLTLAPASTIPLDAIVGDTAMWVSHAIAAAVTIAALYRGERGVLRLMALARDIVAWAARTFGVGLGAIPVPLRPVRLRATRTSRLPVTGPTLSSLQRRGPPVLA